MPAAPFYVFYVFAIGFVAAVLFVAVDGSEPNRWYALVFKFLILVVGATAIANELLP